MIRLKNKADIENTILKKEIAKLQELQLMAQNTNILADLEVDNFVRQATEEEISQYDLKGRDPRGLLIEKDIRIEMIDKKNKVIIQKLYEITKKNLELEQEIAQSNKRFRDLLQAKSK